MNDCISCGAAILGDGTEDSDWSFLCKDCQAVDCYELLVDEEE